MPYKDPQKAKESQRLRSARYRNRFPEKVKKACEQWRQSHKKAASESSMRWAKAHPENVRKNNSRYQKSEKAQSRMKTPESKRRQKKWMIKYQYGLTSEDFERLEAAYSGKCPICGRTDRELCVDHDHNTGVVRGMLCRTCNAGLGCLGDSVEGLIKALSYLQSHNRPEDVA